MKLYAGYSYAYCDKKMKKLLTEGYSLISADYRTTRLMKSEPKSQVE